MRGRGYGAQALSLLGERKKTVIPEIDPPKDEVSVRRKAFYERAGYRANPFDINMHGEMTYRKPDME